jgi:hypothetical protein
VGCVRRAFSVRLMARPGNAGQRRHRTATWAVGAPRSANRFANQRVATRWDAMGSEFGEMLAQAWFRGIGWDALVGVRVGLGPGALTGVQVRILSRALHLASETR